ncbi:MAG: preprotein translocase subunit YajC [Acutalibacteraceae bacterium]|nr:preprotein translocase subunit YajC [Acutalibacteraceae bacterium]
MKKLILTALGVMATLSLTSCASTSSTTSSSTGTDTTSMIGMIVVYVLLFAAMYFFLIRPNSKKKKQEEELRNSLEIGDELITIGGIMGRVVSIKDDDSFILETGPDRTKMQFKKWAISTIVTEKELPDPKADKKKEKETKKKAKAEEK